MLFRKINYLILILFFNVTTSYAVKISGIIKNEGGEYLPFATIYVEELDYGTTSNLEGYYEIELKKGNYTLIYQFLGYGTLVKNIEINIEDIILDVELVSQSLVLPSLVYKAGSEDPAYAIMRRVIAKSKYHQYQLDYYRTRVYVKGSGRLIKAPFFIRNRLEKEGIDSSRVFMVESLSEIEFKLPNTYNQKVLSVNSIGMENSPDPMPFIKASFYQPRVANALSPVSPEAFNHYSFRYEGFFKDQEVIVNKIYVEPKIRGDMVFEGYLYIVDELWALHSLDFDTFYQGFDVNIKQVYHPVEPMVWMPVTHRFNVKGTIFGFEFEFKYVAVNNEYEVNLNEQLIEPDSISSKASDDDSLIRKIDTLQLMNLKPGEKLSKKEMRKVMRSYEKQALKQVEQKERIMFRENIRFDSSAYERDSLYWASIRPVPLSNLEIKGYELKDSLRSVSRENFKKDSIRNEKNKKFRIQHIIIGNDYPLSAKTSFTWRPLWDKISFNTVEGWNIHGGLDLKIQLDSSKSISFGSTARYGFSSKLFYGLGHVKYNFRQHLRTGELKLSGGKYIYQINRNDPIPPSLNMIGSLFFRENFMKLFERNFVDFSLRKPLSPFFILMWNASWEEKRPLENSTDFSFTDQDKEYSPNNPENSIIGDTKFDPYTFYSSDLQLLYYPFLKFFERNDERSIIQDSSPIISLGYSFGISPESGSRIFVHRVNTGIRYGKSFGVGNRFEMYLGGSRIFSNKSEKIPFPEFIHFNGNRTPLITGDIVTSFRMLDYYFYSTNRYNFESHLLYQFRKLFITQIIYARMAGIREDILIKYLYADSLENYIEIGYALDNLFNFFRIELIGQYENFNYRGLGIRIGFSKNISLN
jgi:hypothetical protein